MKAQVGNRSDSYYAAIAAEVAAAKGRPTYYHLSRLGEIINNRVISCFH